MSQTSLSQMGFGAGTALMRASMALALREGGLVSRTTWSLGPIHSVGGLLGDERMGGGEGVAYWGPIVRGRSLVAMVLAIGRLGPYLGL